MLLFKSDLKDGGLEIVTQIHVFYDGQTFVEEWEILAEESHTASMPARTWNLVDLEKVSVEEALVHVKLKVPVSGGKIKEVAKTYDFSGDEPSVHQ